MEQRVLQALMVKRFPKIVAQLEKADTSVEVRNHFAGQCSNVKSAREGCVLDVLDVPQSISLPMRALSWERLPFLHTHTPVLVP